MFLKITISVIAIVLSVWLVNSTWQQKFQPLSKARIKLFIAGFVGCSTCIWIIEPQYFNSLKDAIEVVFLCGTIGGVLFSFGMPKRYRYFVMYIEPQIKKKKS